MYIQITTRCNMECDHCGMNCTAEGEDMSFKTFRKALDLSEGAYMTLGGGEPTIHPDFKLFLIEAIASDAEGVHIITNGKHKRNAKLIANLIRKEVIDGGLSQDYFHNSIDDETIQFFTDANAIHDTSNGGMRNPINAGRAKEFYDEEELLQECICNGYFIKPNGDVHLCGCEDSLCIGNINDEGFELPYVENEEFQDCECWSQISPNGQKEIKKELAGDLVTA